MSYLFMSPLSQKYYHVDPDVRHANSMVAVDTSVIDGQPDAVKGSQSIVRNSWIQHRNHVTQSSDGILYANVSNTANTGIQAPSNLPQVSSTNSNFGEMASYQNPNSIPNPNPNSYPQPPMYSFRPSYLEPTLDPFTVSASPTNPLVSALSKNL